GVLARLPEPVRTVRQDKAQRAHEHAHLAVERRHAAKLLARRLLDEIEPAVAFDDIRDGSEGGEALGQNNRPGAWTAAAVWGRERLVQVDMHGVDAEIAGPRLADDGVEIRAVA